MIAALATIEQRTLILKRIGRNATDKEIEHAVRMWDHVSSTTDLERYLADNVESYEQRGNKGTALADEIEAMRIVLALRGSKS